MVKTRQMKHRIDNLAISTYNGTTMHVQCTVCAGDFPANLYLKIMNTSSNKPKQFSESNLPSTIAQAQEAIRQGKAEIVSIETALQARTIRDFRNERGYQSWFTGVTRKKGFIEQEIVFLERWIWKTVDKHNPAGHQQRVEEFAEKVRTTRVGFDYIPKYGADLLEPKRIHEAVEHRGNILVLVGGLNKVMRTMEFAGENDHYLSHEKTRECLQPLLDLHKEISKEIDFLLTFIRLSRLKSKVDIKLLENVISPENISLFREKLANFWISHPHEVMYHPGKPAGSVEEAEARVEELYEISVSGQEHLTNIRSEACNDPYNLTKDEFRVLATAFQKKLGRVSEESGYLTKSFKLKEVRRVQLNAEGMPNAIGGKPVQHLLIPINELKRKLKMTASEILVWVMEHIGEDGKLVICETDNEKFKDITEYVRLHRERIHVEYGDEWFEEMFR